MSSSPGMGEGRVRGEGAGEYDSFINPYTFVPLPQLVDPDGFRRAPAGHAGTAGEVLSGWIDVELHARSPLLVRGVRKGEEERFPRKRVDGEEIPFLPGSTLAGVVRSLYEMLAGGCLRVFREDFVPGYRDAAQQRDERWQLARIASAPSGRPEKVQLCSEVVWVPPALLAKALDGADRVVTGATVNVDTRRAGGRLRKEVTDEQCVTAGDQWVVLLTDSAVRRRSYWCAVGRLSADTATVEDDAWNTFLHAVAGTNDVREARATGRLQVSGAVSARVHFRGTLMGYRHEARAQLFPGQVVWVRTQTEKKRVGAAGRAQSVVEEHRVKEVALSQIWRHTGSFPAGERVPEPLLPCRDPEQLCPACRVFGSADTTGAGRQDNRHSSYRGHVRFGDALPLGPVSTRRELLPPLGSPRPGAGQFYLHTPHEVIPRPGRPALREWGAPPEGAESVRALRGRKTYWLTARHGERPLFRVRHRRWQGNAMASAGECAGEGAVFGFRVYADGLTRAQVGGLLTALDPSLLLGAGTGLAVGGGRPLGYGSCTARVRHMVLQTARSRYTGRSGPEVTVDAAVSAMRESTDEGVRATWPAAAAALALDRVEPGNVWYPPEKPLPKGELNESDLGPGFGFWKMSRGQALAEKTYPLCRLPEVEDADQQLPVAPQAKEHPSSGADRIGGQRNRAKPTGRRRS